MNFLTKAKSAVGSAVGNVSFASVLPMLLIMLLAVSGFAAESGDYSELTKGITDEISGIKTVLIGIGATIIGVSVVFIVVRFVKRMIGG